jgi:hypothetical protein
MHTDNPLNFGTWPSPAEVLQGDYPEWDIWRDITSGCHGDWIARHITQPDRVHRAPDISALRKLLEDDAGRE